MNLLAHLAQLLGEHQFNLGMYVFHTVFYHKFALVGDGINLFELS